MKFRNIKILTIISVLLIFILTSCSPSSKESAKASNTSSNNTIKDSIKVHYIDVGQGDSILIQTENKNMLIDAGPRSSSDKLVKYLKDNGIKNLDIVVATHPHEDHIGGMTSVIKNFKIDKFYAPKKTATTKTFENMVKELKDKNLKINVAKAGVGLDLGKDIKCEMLAPNSEDYEDVNNCSAVIRLSYKDTAFLFTGDAEKISEKEMLQKGYELKADVLKLGHHGSSTSSSKEFLDKVSPKIAVASLAKDNDYGHPHKETLAEMKKRNITLYRTDESGSIVLKSDGKTITKQ